MLLLPPILLVELRVLIRERERKGLEPLAIGIGASAAVFSLAAVAPYTTLDGELVPGRGAGRGSYTCPRLQCFERATSRRAFNRILRANLRVDPELARLYTG